MTKRVWSLLMALALCLSLLPVPALATEGTGDNTDAGTTTDPVAEVTMTASNGTTWSQEYTEILAAFNAARLGRFTNENGDTVDANTVSVELLKHGETYTLPTNLEKNNDFPISFEYGHSVTINLNGCTLERSVTAMQQGILTVNYNANVTIKNGTLDLTNSDDSEYSNPASAISMPSGDNNQTLTLENMTISVTGNGYAINAQGGTLNIKSGTYGKVLINSYENRAKAQLSGGHYARLQAENGTYASLLETGYIFAFEGGTYISPTTMGYISSSDTWQNCTNIQVIECPHTSGYENGACKACGYICPHTNVTGTVCSTCGVQMVAQVGDKYFTTLASAVKAANGGEVTLLTDVEENITITDGMTVTIDLNEKTWEGMGTTWAGCQPVPLTVSGGSVTVKNGTLNQGGASSNANTAVVLNGGSLTVGEGMTIQGGKYDSSTVFPAITVESGGLTLTENMKLYGGMKTSVDGKTLADYLPEETAYYQAPPDGTESVANGYVQELVGNFTLTVREHTHSAMLDKDGKYVCACGYTCSEHHFENGVCTTCGYKCPHPSDKVSEADGVYTCSDCTTQMAVKVTVNSVDTYYAKSFDRTNTENTLQVLLNDDTITPSGSTVTLLADSLNAFAFVDGGKSIKLDLNGKNLIETINNGICVDPNSTLTVTGEGSSTRTGDLDNNEYSFIFNVRGGTLKFDDNFGGTFNGIYVGSGKLTSTGSNVHIGTLEIGDANATISFRAGTFDKIEVGEETPTGTSVTLGNLPAKNTGSSYAFQKNDGTFLRYDTKITKGNAVENVKIVYCKHGSIDTKNDSTCIYCGLKKIVAIVATETGKNAYCEDDKTANEAANYAFGSLNDKPKATLTLYKDVEISAITLEREVSLISGKTYPRIHTVDLNGCKITGGTLTLADGVNVTITDSSADKTGSFANVAVNAGANLIVDGVAVDTINATGKTEDGKAPSITLKEGTKFNNINLSNSGLVLADCLEPGGCIVSRKDLLISRAIHGGDAYTCTVGRIPGTVTVPEDKTGSIPYNGAVSKNLFPTVTITNESNPKLSYAWYRRTDNSSRLIGTATMGNSEYNWIPEDNAFQAVNIDDTLDAICVITAKNEQNDLLWETAVTGYELTVAKGTAFVTTAPKAVPDLTYSGSAKNLITAGSGTGGTMQYSLTENGTYSETIPTGENAGEYTVWYKVVGDDNHNDSEAKSLEVKIAPKPVENPGITVDTISYSGEPLEPTVTVKDGNTVIDSSEYTVSYSNNINAGVDTATVTITDKEDGNYTVNGSANFSIYKAVAPTNTQSGTLNIANNHAATYTYDVSQLLPQLGGTKKYGDVTYTPSWSATDSSYVVGTPTIDENGLLTLSVNAVDKTEAKQIGYVTVTVQSTNYSNFDFSVYVNAVNKIVPTGEPTLSKTTLTYGDKLSDITLSGSMKDGNENVAGTFAWNAPETTPAAGNYQAAWTFTPTNNGTYAEVTGTSNITVNKATPTGAPKYTAISGSGKTLGDAGLTTVGGTFSVAGSVKWVDAEGHDLDSATEVKSNTAYKWVFTPTDNTNYNTIEGSVTLWHRSSSSSSGSTTPATPGKTEITTNPDGSIKITPPKSGEKTKVEIPVKDVTPGTVAIIVKPDGTEEIVKDALPTENGIELTVDGSVTVKIVDNAKEFVDTKGHWAEDAIDFVSARGLVNGMTETTFAPNAPTTRAQLWTILARQADADLTGGSTWYEKAQAWAKTSGISDGSDPDGNITRAQMVTMLWRAAGSPAVSGSSAFTDVPGDSYYAQAVAWAAEKGITTGVGDGKFDPNGTCTRAQIATFLYRTYVNKI